MDYNSQELDEFMKMEETQDLFYIKDEMIEQAKKEDINSLIVKYQSLLDSVDKDIKDLFEETLKDMELGNVRVKRIALRGFLEKKFCYQEFIKDLNNFKNN